jgi:acyl carrier protein
VTRDQVRQAVLEALLKVVPEAHAADIEPSAPLREQLDIDSMDFMNFVVALDAGLGVDVPEGDYGRLSTLDACVEYLAARLGAPPPSS